MSVLKKSITWQANFKDFMISIIIPSKNRPKLLIKLLNNLAKQTYKNFEIIVIDQSDHRIDECILKIDLKNKIHYIYNPNISGLVEAKKIGFDYAESDFIAFLDDDSRPIDTYFENLLNGFENPEIMGMCGNVLNYEHRGVLKKILYRFFHRGFFRGERIGSFGTDPISQNLIKTHQLTGGCSIWRRIVFQTSNFDLNNRFHYFEDIDFSFRVNKIFPGSLFINLEAKIYDLYDCVGKRNYGQISQNRIEESLRIYLKYRNTGDVNIYSWILYVLGRVLAAIACCISDRSIRPLTGCFLGVIIAIKNLYSIQMQDKR